MADNQTAMQLFGNAREAVTNALKHSRAKNITIGPAGANRSVVLRIRDYGISLPDSPWTRGRV